MQARCIAGTPGCFLLFAIQARCLAGTPDTFHGRPLMLS